MLDQVKAALPNWDWDRPGFSQTIHTVPVATTAASASLMGRVNYFNCNGKKLTLSGHWRNTVFLLNNCDVAFSGNAVLEDSIAYNSSTDPKKSFNVQGSGNLVLGQDSDCDGTGRAVLLMRGGFDAPAKLSFLGGTIIARENVSFAAQFSATGITIIAGGTINPASHNSFTACPPPPGAPPALVSFRLAR
jgi:hypothetical protein